MSRKLKVVALVSGGKDSCYSMLQCVAAGHEIVALANLRPHDQSSKFFILDFPCHTDNLLLTDARKLELENEFKKFVKLKGDLHFTARM